jgi:glycosyltransferase involved in cell wall biosynthesis
MKRLRRFDVVHVYGLYELLGPVVALFCQRRGIPYVLEPIGMGRASGGSLGKKRSYNFLLGRRLVRNAAIIIATSAQEQQALLHDGIPRDRLVLRRNGVDLSQFDPPPPQGRFRARAGIGQEGKVVLFLGRMAPIKNLDMLIEAFASLGNRDERLVFVGPDEGDGYVRHLKELADRLALDGRVHFAGPLYGQEKVEALADADVLVLPSHSESFGMAALEAMACGKPVVVTEECGIAPYVEGRAGLVVRREKTAIAEGIHKVLGDPDMARRFGQEGKTIAAQLSWDEPVAQMENLYSQAVERRRAG